MLKKISSYIIVLAIGAGIGTYFDAKHTIEEKIVYKDRVKTEIKEVIKEAPDGTKITERTIYKDEKKDTKIAKKEGIPVKKDWAVGVKYDLLPVGEPVWTAEVQRRILGDIYVGAYGRTDGVAGVSITILL